MLMSEIVADIVNSIWSTVLERAIEPTDPSEVPAEQDTFTACIQVSGGFSGVITARFPSLLARKVAAAMLAIDGHDASDDDLRDSLGELVNMIGGNLKATLPPPSALSLPWVTIGNQYRVTFPNCKTLECAHFLCEGDRLIVTVMEADPTQADGSAAHGRVMPVKRPNAPTAS